MRQHPRRRPQALRLETLENRTLLSADGGTLWLDPGPQPFSGAGPNLAPADLLMVQFKDSTPASEIHRALESLGASIARSFLQGPSQVVLGPGFDETTALTQLQANPF